jgi:hypothetical protein
MRKKLCFNCRDPWVPGHRCMGKGEIHYIEVAKTVWTVRRRSRTMDPLAQRRSQHRKRSSLPIDHRHRQEPILQ